MNLLNMNVSGLGGPVQPSNTPLPSAQPQAPQDPNAEGDVPQQTAPGLRSSITNLISPNKQSVFGAAIK